MHFIQLFHERKLRRVFHSFLWTSLFLTAMISKNYFTSSNITLNNNFIMPVVRSCTFETNSTFYITNYFGMIGMNYVTERKQTDALEIFFVKYTVKSAGLQLYFHYAIFQIIVRMNLYRLSQWRFYKYRSVLRNAKLCTINTIQIEPD